MSSKTTFCPPDVMTDAEIRVVLTEMLTAELIDFDIKEDIAGWQAAQSEISQYVEAVIKLNHGEPLTASEEAAYYKMLYRLQRKREEEAVRILRSGEGRQDKRLREAARRMGWVTDKKTSRFSGLVIFHEYLELIMGSCDPVTFKAIEPVSKIEALEILARRYGFNSPNACRQLLKDYITKRRKDGASIPPILPSSDG